jgi:hypothetical protein
MRRLLACVLVAAIASCGGGDDDKTLAERVAEAQDDTGEGSVRRITGDGPYATAAAIALDEYDSASDPILANGDDPADALAGS